jgi:hypothetical protein
MIAREIFTKDIDGLLSLAALLVSLCAPCVDAVHWCACKLDKSPSNQSSISQQSQQCDCSHSDLMPGQPGQLKESGLIPLHTSGAASRAACLAKDRPADDQARCIKLVEPLQQLHQPENVQWCSLLCEYEGTWLHPK